MARVPAKHLRKIAPKGKAALTARIRSVRASWPTDEFLEIVNADLPDDMTSDAAITTWLAHASYPYSFRDAIEAMGRFGEIAALPEWAYSVDCRGLFFGILLLGQESVRRVADEIIHEHSPRRSRLQRTLTWLRAHERALARAKTDDYPILDLGSRVAALHAGAIIEAVIMRLLKPMPPGWAQRLRRCPGPGCAAPYFWTTHDAAVKVYCSPTCQKAAARAVRVRRSG